MRTRVSLLLVLIAASTGCRPIVKSVPVATGKHFEMKQAGVYYCLPRRLVSLTITRDAVAPKPGATPVLVDDVQARLLPAVADPESCYVARLSHSWLSTDEIQLTATSKGVLAGVNVASEDETGDIVVVLAKTFVTIASLVAAPPAAVMGLMGLEEGRPRETKRACTPPTRAHYEFVFDPSQRNEANRVTRELQDACLPYVLKLTPNGAEAGDTVATAADEYDGLLYRRPVSYRIRLDRIGSAAEGSGPVLETTAELPNGGAVLQAKIDGSMLVRTSYSAKFEHGVLTDVKATKPSEALAWASLPLSILGVVAGPIGNFLRVNVNYDSKHEDVLKAQRVVIEQQTEQLRAATAPKPGAPSPDDAAAKVPAAQ